MGSIGTFMFHVIGVTILVIIALQIAALAMPRPSRRTRRARQAPQRRAGDTTDGREMHHTGRR